MYVVILHTTVILHPNNTTCSISKIFRQLYIAHNTKKHCKRSVPKKQHSAATKIRRPKITFSSLSNESI